MKRLVRGVYLLSDTGYRAYLLQTDEGNILVDAPSLVIEYLIAIRELGGATTLFITHRDDESDACAWKEELGVEIAVHDADAPYVLDCAVDRELQDGDRLTLDTLVIHVPGHSPGSCALLFEREGGVLFTGDALITNADGLLTLPPAHYSDDIVLARESIQRLLPFEFDAILPAHGEPILTGAKQALEALVAALRRENQ